MQHNLEKASLNISPRCISIIFCLLHRTRKMQQQGTDTSLLYMEIKWKKKLWATYHVQQHYHESPGLTGCQLGRMSCEVTTVPVLPQGMDLLYHADSLGKVRDQQRYSHEKDMSMVIQQMTRCEGHGRSGVKLKCTSSSRQFYSPTFLWSIHDSPICVGGIFPWSNPWAGLCNCTGVPWRNKNLVIMVIDNISALM